MNVVQKNKLQANQKLSHVFSPKENEALEKADNTSF
jgi:hypothetical protein